MRRSLLRKASQNGLVIKVDTRPGDFVVERARLLQVWPRECLSAELGEALCEPIVIGPKRTPTQDIDFAVAALVEIALRALSPGINDPQTAMTCIDRLSAALAEIMEEAEPPSLVPDAEGMIRLIVRPATFEAVIGAAFDPIRHAGRDHARVLRRLADPWPCWPASRAIGRSARPSPARPRRWRRYAARPPSTPSAGRRSRTAWQPCTGRSPTLAGLSRPGRAPQAATRVACDEAGEAYLSILPGRA